MKITKRQLRRIIREEKARILAEGRRVDLEDVEVGKSYDLGYRRDVRFTAKFNGWELTDGGPRMKWENADGTQWEAYMFQGTMVLGSSADKLLIFGEAEQMA